MNQLFLARGEEALGDRVVVTVAARAHRPRDPGFAGGLPERQRDELPGLNPSSQQCLST